MGLPLLMPAPGSCLLLLLPGHVWAPIVGVSSDNFVFSRHAMQVYKATLSSDGSEVAVKVQRPGVATAIALDVHILRHLAAWVKRWRKVTTNLPALLDEWAGGWLTKEGWWAAGREGVGGQC